jgi:hypothetical protein
LAKSHALGAHTELRDEGFGVAEPDKARKPRAA